MTDKQITALAREYAEETHHGNTVAVDEAILTIRFLLQRYCLVEKSKAREARALALDSHLKDSHLTDEGAKYIFDKLLFPDLGKEVEG